MENPLGFDRNIFDYIDALQDVETVKAVRESLDDSALKKIFWASFKKYLTAKSDLERQKARLKCTMINRYFGASIPLKATVKPFTTPHAFYGIFISSLAKIGKGCTIFQHVTIGSNTLLDSKSAGAPTIGDNVYIGTGARIIGNVKVGNNVRIGAGCTVTRDVPDNCTVVQAAPFVIQKNFPQDNRWISMTKWRKLKVKKVKRSSKKIQSK